MDTSTPPLPPHKGLLKRLCIQTDIEYSEELHQLVENYHQAKCDVIRDSYDAVDKIINEKDIDLRFEYDELTEDFYASLDDKTVLIISGGNKGSWAQYFNHKNRLYTNQEMHKTPNVENKICSVTGKLSCTFHNLQCAWTSCQVDCTITEKGD